MLRAALQPGPEARQLAVIWLSNADIDSLQFSSLRLMPQLYDRLRREGIEDPLLPKLKGLKKHTWSKNQLLFRGACDAIRALQQAGIDVMVIKGMAMIVGYYHDYSLRPMNDADLLVPYRHARRACEILSRHGWTNEYEDPANPQFSEWAFQHEHAAQLYDSLRRDLDLHWNLFWYRIGADVDADFWAASAETAFGSQRVRILNPADQLLHICVHATDLAPICWVPDVLAVLRSTPNLDWDRLLTQARKRNFALMTAAALQLVQRDFGDIVPASVVTELKNSPVPRFEKYEYRQMSKPASSLFVSEHKMIYKFLRLSRGMSLPDRLHFSVEYLCFEWKVTRKRQLPAEFCVRAAAKLRAFLRPS